MSDIQRFSGSDSFKGRNSGFIHKDVDYRSKKRFWVLVGNIILIWKCEIKGPFGTRRLVKSYNKLIIY